MGLENANRNAHEVARNMLNSTQKKMKRDYDVKILEKQYEKGDVVYVLDTASIKGKCRKLSTPWKGPGVPNHCLPSIRTSTNTIFLSFFYVLWLYHTLSPIQLSLTFLKPKRYLPVPTRLESVMIGCKNDSLKFCLVRGRKRLFPAVMNM
jgi:hypothetical protein